MKKLIILLLFCQFSFAQYNLFARQNFAYKVNSPTYNTYIGGVSGTITSASSLATKLGISVGNISNFTIVGSDIKCKITGTYTFPINAFNAQDAVFPNILTYYTDTDNLAIGTTESTFYGQTNFTEFKLQGLINLYQRDFSNTRAFEYYLPNTTSVNNVRAFDLTEKAMVFYLPNCTKYGTSHSVDDANFAGFREKAIIYANPTMATINAGGVDADLAGAITRGAIVRYVTSFVAPNPITDLSVSNVYSSAIQVNFTAPTGSTNAIDFYDCYANGVFKNRITASGQYITGLANGVNYSLEVKPVDIFYNKSSSNLVSQTTSTPTYTDTDANASIAAKTLTGVEAESEYALIVELKAKSLYTKCQTIYTFKGTTSAQHKFNSKNPVDTDAGFRITFTGAATFSNNGYQTNGSGYGNTHFIPSASQTLNSNGMTIVSGTNNATASGDVVDAGSQNSGTQSSFIVVKNNNSTFQRAARMNSTVISQNGVNEARGIFTGTKQSATVTDLFRNKVQIATGTSGGTLTTLPGYVGALNLGGSPYGYSNQRIQMLIYHDGLTDDEVVSLHSVIDLSETIAGRKTW